MEPTKAPKTRFDYKAACPECGKQKLSTSPVLNHTGECSQYPHLQLHAEAAVRAIDALTKECIARGKVPNAALNARMILVNAYLGGSSEPA